ncbi:helix-turn-helix domain-containing protein [Larkinella rosea]|uniref:AraC family transcriptional regulator n=1 Tax=Larkinella rosea TaxID=2025312 RepID=A0A3P1C0T0_9BACT|nr:helix-turn-helix domain-containing protein [Larkinella rosea]RRB07021.1 AraC family transcriptional regulator [Larkinella rosea]
MRFDSFIPIDRLKPYISHFVISEKNHESVYKVFPGTSLVIGIQYGGSLKTGKTGIETNLSTAGITGIADEVKLFSNSAHIGTILIYFTELGLAHFTSCPANELFNLNVSLENIFEKQKILDIEDKLGSATTDQERIRLVELFLLSQLKDSKTDKLIIEAVRLIYQAKGAIRIRALNQRLMISQSPFEKRFRKLVGTTPKKFASIVRFNTVLSQLNGSRSLMDICFENNFFDQAHFSKDFKAYTGESPETFRRFY